MPRPTLRTPEVEKAITGALAKGNSRKAAAAVGGVSYQTLREWEKAFPEFAESLEKAEGMAQRTYLSRIATAADKGTWQAAAWILERRWPSDYGRREAVEMSGPDGGPIDTRDVGNLADHERTALAAAIRAHLRGEGEPEGSPAPAGEG